MHRYWGTAERIAAGDFVEYAGRAGRVVFIVEEGAFSPEFPAADWGYLGRGVGIQIEGGELYFFPDASDEEDLVLHRRV